MNVAIVGSRSFEDYARLAKCVAEVLAERRILMSEVQVISGGAVGVDALAGARGTAVHTNYNWNDPYWHSHKYGYWNGQRGYWHVVNGKHVFVVVQ